MAEMVEFGDFYFREVDPPAELKAQFYTRDLAPVFESLIDRFSHIELSDKAMAEEAVKALLDQFNLKFKTIAQPMRLALTGKTVSPGIFEIIATLGRDRVVPRLEKALSAMNA
jgi:glutamyl-tRNA synthetase